MTFAVVVLVRGSEERSLGQVGSGDHCDLGFVDSLLHLQLAVRRFGWSVRLEGVSDELLELVDLVGLRRELSRPEASAGQASRYGGRPNCSNSSG